MITADLLTPPVNLRDMGGLPVRDGVLRADVLVRSDDLATIPEDSARDLVERGLRAVIDLRSPEEVAYTGRGPLASTAVGYHHLPFLANMAQSVGSDGSWRDLTKFGESYAGLVETAGSSIVAALGVIATTPGTVAFHCAAGKDRTGVLAASVLLALGAADEVIATDYDRTGENYAAIQQRLHPTFGGLWGQLGIDLDAMARAAGSDGFTYGAMADALTLLRQRHGDPLVPLRAAGLTDALVLTLRDRIVA